MQVIISDYESRAASDQPPSRRQSGRWCGRKEEFLIVFLSLISPHRCSSSSCLASNRSYQGWRKLAVLLDMWKYMMIVPWRIKLWASYCFLSWRTWNMRKCSERQVSSLYSEYKNSLTALSFPACLHFADVHRHQHICFQADLLCASLNDSYWPKASPDYSLWLLALLKSLISFGVAGWVLSWCVVFNDEWSHLLM